MAYEPAKLKYLQWKQRRALAQAQDFITEKDYPKAKLALTVALTAVPGNTQALRVAADMLEQAGSPEVMILRRRLLLLDAHSLQDRVALIHAALRYDDVNAARDALRGMPLDQADEPAAIKAALSYALATDNRPVADALFDRLKGLEPANEQLKIMHALLRMKSPRPETVQAARAELEKFSQEPRYALMIRRDMLLSAMQRGDHGDARRLAKLIATDAQATLNDKLNEANFALNVDHRPFGELFAGLMPDAEKSAGAAADLARWAMLVGQPAKGAAWLRTLGEAIRSAPEIAAVRAELAAAQSDWDGLAALLESGAWGRIERDVVRLAFSARLAADRGNASLQRQIWGEALSASARSLAGLNALYRLAGYWHWEAAGESALWAITRAYPQEAWAHQTLFNVYRERRDTENMRALIGELRDSDGSMLRYRHDWALLTLLTTPSPAWNTAKQTMRQLYEFAPDNAYYATGYAFALAQADRANEALDILQKLPPQELALPERAPYLAYIYGMTWRRADFDRAAAKAAGLKTLLPEEHALFGQGREALDRPVSRRVESGMEAKAKAAAPASKADGS
ncbi:MAG: hypothetical protein IT582_03370 [Opitutaceae bacterium]|nr:hypothetical protein [Opitutaceae bacterium]